MVELLHCILTIACFAPALQQDASDQDLVFDTLQASERATSASVCMPLKHLKIYAMISVQVTSRWLLRKRREEF